MKHFIAISTLLLAGLSSGIANANNVPQAETVRAEINALKAQQARLKNELNVLSSNSNQMETKLVEMQMANERLTSKADSLQARCDELTSNQKTDKSELTKSIGLTNQSVQDTDKVLRSRSLWCIGGLVVLLLAIVAAIIIFMRKFRTGNALIDEVRKAQEALQTAQTKVQEEAVKFDNQLLEIIQKQLDAFAAPASKSEPDHSLALKVADEIARIELNMSRMDSSVRGYKQLVKAVERIKDNFRANGYEIVDMLGKPYNEGMKVIANFVIDEDLDEGKQIITGITKPQVNYDGVMIQAAQITVSQNI